MPRGNVRLRLQSRRCGSRLTALWILMASSPGPAQTPNFPPVARATASRVEAAVGEAITFSASSSSDPDAGPHALTYFWELGDGEESTSPEVAHAFQTPGAFIATLTVDDGADTAVDVVTVYILVPPAPGVAAHSTPIALTPAADRLWAVNEDSDSVTVFAVEETAPWLRKLAEVPVGRHPRTLSVSPDGTLVYVAEEEAGSVAVIDGERFKVARSASVGFRPYGVVALPAGGRVIVTLEATSEVAILEPGTLALRKRIAVEGFPRAIAVPHDGRQALVSSFLSVEGAGRITVLDLETEEVSRTIELPADPGPDTPSSGRGVPNLLSALAVEPGGTAAWVGGLKSNVARGLFRSGQPLGAVNRVRGLLAKLDLGSAQEVPERRIDLNNADSGSAVAFSLSGRYAYVTHQGLGSLSVYDLAAATLVEPGEGNTVPFAARVAVGDAPQGIVLSPEGTRTYVLASLSRAVTVLDLADPARPMVLATVEAAGESLPPAVARGKRLFFQSGAPVHSSAGYIACASCHPDGGMPDGQTWDFTDAGEGLRNTIDLRGRGGLAHGPLHWSANFDEVQDFENDIVKAFGGTGLAGDGSGPHQPLAEPNAGRGADLDALAAYVSSLAEVPPSPHRGPDGSLTEAARRGREVFFREETGCAGCHVPPRFTDSTLAPDPAAYVLHDVGTLTAASGGRLGGPLPGLDTPTLKGVWVTAPYLHDGSAPTLLDVLATHNSEDRHGKTSQLSPAELEDLVAFLLSLDERPGGDPFAPYRRGDANCDGTVNISDPLFGLGWLFLGGPATCCEPAGNANGDERTDISDAAFTLAWLFLGGPAPPSPGPFACGEADDDGDGGAGDASCAYPGDRCE